MHPLSRLRARAGFTLIEILVAATVTIILVGILLRISTLASTTVGLSTQKLSAFASARAAFDIITRNLSQATLNTYLDYYDSSGKRRTAQDTAASTFIPASFGRASDLQFVIQANVANPNYGQEVYFQVPRAYSANADYQSVSGLFNACGYYVQFGNLDGYEPTAVLNQEQAGKVRPKYRYRLMQGLEPTENLHIFTATALSGTGTTNDNSGTWLDNIKNGTGPDSTYITPLADNVIAFIVWPRLSAADEAAEQAAGTYVPLTTDYTYDSQKNVAPTGPAGGPYTQSLTADQLPPDVQVTMVVIDEASATRIQGTSATAPSVIETALAGKFSIPDNYETDMNDLAAKLSAAHINYQFFNTTVAMRESKWSTPQSN